MNPNRKPPSKDKSAVRNFFIEKRKILLKNHKVQKDALDREIESRLILSPEYRGAQAILLYAARDNEIATAAIFYAAFANAKAVAYPRCEAEGVMRFYRVRSLCDLIPGRYGILEPRAGCEPFIPDEKTLCVCPCLCCDMRGGRLGWGGGYYDRFLGDFAGVKAALCYSEAVLTEIVREAHDVPVDMIVTDSFIKRLADK
jgi:5-formyltetrahydrofolate cyclo-ligase